MSWVSLCKTNSTVFFCFQYIDRNGTYDPNNIYFGLNFNFTDDNTLLWDFDTLDDYLFDIKKKVDIHNASLCIRNYRMGI